MNKAYARQWIGEVLLLRGEHALAYVFLQTASRLWEQVSPPRVSGALALMSQIEQQSTVIRLKEKAAEKVCLEWIVGHDIEPDLQFRRPSIRISATLP